MSTISEAFMVPVVDLARRWIRFEKELQIALTRVLQSGRLLLGDELEAFESEFAAYCQAQHAVGVSSGTAALTLALQAIDVGHGDEVIVPDFTAVPTAAAVCTTGAVPVPVDVLEDTGTIDPEAANQAITDKTKAIIAVHLYGRPVEMQAIYSLGIPVIEDAAQAHGALPPMTDADSSLHVATAYSFYPTKNLGGIGDGGAVVTNNQALAKKIRLLRNHGMKEQYVHEVIATNARMSEIEAAALRITLPELDKDNQRRRQIVKLYRQAAPSLNWHEPHKDHVYHLCVARVPNRDKVREKLPFQTAIHYPLPISKQPAYRQFARHKSPNAADWAKTCLTIPCFPELTDSEINEIISGLKQIKA